MAGRLYLPFSNPVLDDDGNPRAGALVSVYEDETTTPVTTYTDFDLTTPHEPEIEADDSGVLPAIYVPDKLFYRVKLATADGVQIDQQDNCPALGEDWGVIARDFSPHGRFKVFGSGGYTRIWTGDSAGDDAGGSFRWSGWGDTQGDDATFDFAEFTVTGDLTYGDDRKVGLDRITGGVVSDVAALDIALPADYDCFRLILRQVTVGTDTANLAARKSDDGGETFYSDSSYAFTSLWVGSTGGASAANSSGTSIPISGGMEQGGGGLANFFAYDIHRNALRIRGGGDYGADVGAGVFNTTWYGGGYCANHGNPATHMRILASSGNFSLTYALYGYRAAGDLD